MITVVIPSYNSQETIERAINSIIKQTKFYLVDEILVVDDSSTDWTLQRVKAVPSNKIKIISLEKNSGSAAIPRNIGINHASGDLIAFLDSDDYWYPNHLESSLEILDENVALTCSNAHTQNNEELLPKLFNRRITTLELLIHNSIIMSSVVCKANIFQNSNFYFSDSSEKNLYNDYLLWLKISFKNNIQHINKFTLFYNRTLNSDSSKYAHPISAEKNTVLDFLKWTKQSSYSSFFSYTVFYHFIYFLKKSKTYLFSL